MEARLTGVSEEISACELNLRALEASGMSVQQLQARMRQLQQEVSGSTLHVLIWEGEASSHSILTITFHHNLQYFPFPFSM